MVIQDAEPTRTIEVLRIAVLETTATPEAAQSIAVDISPELTTASTQEPLSTTPVLRVAWLYTTQ